MTFLESRILPTLERCLLHGCGAAIPKTPLINTLEKVYKNLFKGKRTDQFEMGISSSQNQLLAMTDFDLIHYRTRLTIPSSMHTIK